MIFMVDANCTCDNLLQPLNNPLGRVVIVACILAVSSVVHPIKASLSIVETFWGMVMLVKLQLRKAWLPIFMMEVGNVLLVVFWPAICMVERELLLNAFSKMVITTDVVSKLMVLRAEHSSKACLPMEFTPLPKVTFLSHVAFL